MSCMSSNVYPKKNYKLDFYKLYRICPKCDKRMFFHIQGNIAGTMGEFKCICGYKDVSVDNFMYATRAEREEFEEATKDIMW